MTARFSPDHLNTQFDRDAGLVSTIVIGEIKQTRHVVQAVRSLFESSQTVEPWEFKLFCSHELAADGPVDMLLWVPREAPGSTESFLVKHIESEGQSGIRPGYDMGSIPEFKAAAQKARRSGKTTVAVQETASGDKLVFLLSPVMVHGPGPATVSEGTSNLEGFAVGILNMADLFNILRRRDIQPAGLNMDILDVARTGGTLLFEAKRLGRNQVKSQNR